MSNRSATPLLSLLVLTSCGLLGIGNDSDPVNLDPDFQAAALAERLNTPLAKSMDSLIGKIDAAPMMVPKNLAEAILVVETYDNYADFLKTGQSKFNKSEDSRQTRRMFKRYQKRKDRFIPEPRYQIIYRTKKAYENMDIVQYRYVLKTTQRVDYDPNHVTITSSGAIYPWVQTQVFYIFDRQTKEVFRELRPDSLTYRRRW